MASLYDLSTSAIRRIYDRRVSSAPVLDVESYFPDAQRFQSAWPQLRDEALRVADDLKRVPASRAHAGAGGDLGERRPRLADAGAEAYGTVFPRNVERCPVLAATVASAAGVLSAALSFLAPGKRVPEHRGPSAA